jgi:DNA-binding beta-propeller fold protein YncE
MKWIALHPAAALLLSAAAGWAAEPAPLQLESKIPLGEVSGRIDHFAVDSGRQRLFVAELGNDSVGVIDLKERKLLRTITGFKEPQGVEYVPSTDTLYVANAGDGTVRLFQGADLAPAGRIDLGDDADNIRFDAAANRVYIGYGGGALAVIDPATHAKIGDIRLKAHPEAFQIDAAQGRIFANVPDAGQIAVIDRAAGKQIASWPMRDAAANFPMAINNEAHLVIVAFRAPARLMAFAQDGAVVASVPSCGDADDVFVDTKRQRLYVSCGEGVVDVLQRSGAGYQRIAGIPTVSGARTALFLPEADRLFVAVRAARSEPAAVWVFRPAP